MRPPACPRGILVLPPYNDVSTRYSPLIPKPQIVVLQKTRYLSPKVSEDSLTKLTKPRLHNVCFRPRSGRSRDTSTSGIGNQPRPSIIVSGGRKLHRFGGGKFLCIISAQKLILSLRSKKIFSTITRCLHMETIFKTKKF